MLQSDGAMKASRFRWELTLLLVVLLALSVSPRSRAARTTCPVGAGEAGRAAGFRVHERRRKEMALGRGMGADPRGTLFASAYESVPFVDGEDVTCTSGGQGGPQGALSIR